MKTGIIPKLQVWFGICLIVLIFASCKKDTNNPSNTNPDLATVSTDSVKGITFYSALVVSTVSKEGKSAVTGMGIAYGKNPNPTVVGDNNIPLAKFGVGTFTTNLSNLERGSNYYVRAYATNAAGTAYGNQLSFTTATSLNPVDVDGNIYTAVTIGTQVWMKENLKVSKFRNGDPIPTNLSNSAWQNTKAGAYAIYNDNASNIETYGKLYNWYAVVDSRNLCPLGWHVPSDGEWATLENYLGGASVAGGKLKSTSSLWTSPNTGATNESGFSGLPGGLRNYDGNYYLIGNDGYWWSSPENSSSFAWYQGLSYDNSSSYRYYDQEQSGFSVRCLKD
jgi:uncharacterized protein (TIGR02145 family)